MSLSLGELCPDESCEAEAARFYRWIRKRDIWPQHILYSPQEVRRFNHLRQKGLFGKEHPYCLFVLGRYATQTGGTLAELESFVTAHDPEACPWAACCFGKNENQVMIAATARGGHVRIGFENNLWLPDGSIARDNAELIAAYLNSLEDIRRKPARAEDIKEWFF